MEPCLECQRNSKYALLFNHGFEKLGLKSQLQGTDLHLHNLLEQTTFI